MADRFKIVEKIRDLKSFNNIKTHEEMLEISSNEINEDINIYMTVETRINQNKETDEKNLKKHIKVIKYFRWNKNLWTKLLEHR